MKITYLTSEEHTKKLIVEFFARTSFPRLIQEYLEKQQKENQHAV